MKKNNKEKEFYKLISLGNCKYSGLKGKLNKIRKKKLDECSLRDLVFLSRHNDPYVRDTVVEIVLDKIEKKNKYEKDLSCLLLIGMGDRDSRYNAIKGLDYCSLKNAVFLLGCMLLQDKDPLVRIQASEALAFSKKNSMAAPFLKQSLFDKDPLVRSYSAYGLALLNSKKSVPKITKLQRADHKMPVKVACWGALLLLTRKRIWFDKLLGVMNHKDYHVPMQSINYLESGVREKIISKKDVAPRVKELIRREKRKAVVSRMRVFLRRLS